MPKDKVRVIIATDDDVQYNGHVAQDVRNKAAVLLNQLPLLYRMSVVRLKMLRCRPLLQSRIPYRLA